jgi:threonylcarbamoyladenosine tRNA methylthiotransferase CDKAL1
MKSVFINSVGCTENIIDGAIMKKIAESANYTFTNDPRGADLIILNTCAFKKGQEDLSTKLIEKYHEIKKDGARLVVTGCLVNINRERLDSVFSGTSFAPAELNELYPIVDLPKKDGVAEVHFIPEDIANQEMFGQRATIEKVYRLRAWFKSTLKISLLPNFDLLEYIGDARTLYVRIARGCPNNCGYCAVRLAQGKLTSQPTDAIVQAIKEGIRQGFNKINLVATNSSAYGKDIGTSFLDLLEEILRIEGDYRLMIHNFEPFGMLEDPERFLALFSSPKIYSFYCPINSGSQNVLDRMNRRYDLEQVIAMLKRLRHLNPSVLIRTELIAGYPGERTTDFVKSIRLVFRFKFNQIDVHKYSPRPNTNAIRLDGQVPFLTKWARLLVLDAFVISRVWVRRLRPI